MTIDIQKELSLKFALNLRQRLEDKESKYYKYNWNKNARLKQKTPPGSWRFWFLIGGRGSGKTRSGTEWVREIVENAKEPLHIGLVGQTVGDVRKVMIDGTKSGLLNISPPYFKPEYIPSRREIIWPNGCKATTYSGDTPDQLRGPEHHYVWLDEPAKFMYLEETFYNMNMGLRLGDNPQALITGTPKPLPILRKYRKKFEKGDNDTYYTRMSTFENEENLPKSFIEDMKDKYEGTRIGRQELYGEILEDVEGALWTPKLIEDNYIDFDDLPEIVWSAVGLDPPGTTTNECGIVLVGKDLLRKKNGILPNYYFLADKSLLGTPQEWGKAGINLWYKSQAHAIYAERNFGGDMVKNTLLGIDDSVLVRELTSSRGKNIRAEPVVSLTEQGRLKFVKQAMTIKLFEEMTEWIPHESKYSPNRLDALVFATIANNKKGGTGIYFK